MMELRVLSGPAVGIAGAFAAFPALHGFRHVIGYLAVHRADPAGYLIAAACGFLVYVSFRAVLAGALHTAASACTALPGGRARAARLYRLSTRMAPLLVRYALIGAAGIAAVGCTGGPPDDAASRPAVVDPGWTGPGRADTGRADTGRADPAPTHRPTHRRPHDRTRHRSTERDTAQAPDSGHSSVPAPDGPGRAVVTVRRGDTLWSIAAAHLPPGRTASDIARSWPRWYEANRDVIGADPDMLLPGDVLHGPDSQGSDSQGS